MGHCDTLADHGKFGRKKKKKEKKKKKKKEERRKRAKSFRTVVSTRTELIESVVCAGVVCGVCGCVNEAWCK